MKPHTEHHLSYREHGVKLTAQERKALARELNPQYEDDDYDVYLAEIEHNARELAESGWVPALALEQNLFGKGS